MSERIYLSPPDLTGDEITFVQDALASNWVAPTGPHVNAFEEELADKLNVHGCVAVNSGTSAIHLGLLALDVGVDDEVICPTLTFCATANPIYYCGARPVFVESESESWNMDPVVLEEAIEDRIRKTGRKPKVIIIVHLYGMPARMNEILRVSSKYQIPVLEDAAEALGSSYNGKPLGTLGEVGVLSFNGNKIITTSGGGAVLSHSTKILDTCRYLRQEAKEPLPYFEHRDIGYNYRLSNVSAAIGRAQLRALPDRVTRRRQNFQFYREKLEKLPGIAFQEESPGGFSNRWLTTISINDPTGSRDNEALRLALEAHNIESRLGWKPMHMQPVYRGRSSFYGSDVSEKLFGKCLCVPSGSNLTQENLARIQQIITGFFQSGML